MLSGHAHGDRNGNSHPTNSSASDSWKLQRICEEEAKSSQWQQAMLLLDFFRHRGMKPSTRGVYSPWFLGGAGRAGNWALSLDVFDEMVAMGSTAESRRLSIWNQVAYQCQKGRSWLQATCLLKDIRRQRVVKASLPAVETLSNNLCTSALPPNPSSTISHEQ